MLIQYILMKHTMVFKRTLLKQLSGSQYVQVDVTSFTATPKHSNTPMKVGMNDWDIFGEVLINVPDPTVS